MSWPKSSPKFGTKIGCQEWVCNLQAYLKTTKHWSLACFNHQLLVVEPSTWGIQSLKGEYWPFCRLSVVQYSGTEPNFSPYPVTVTRMHAGFQQRAWHLARNVASFMSGSCLNA